MLSMIAVAVAGFVLLSAAAVTARLDAVGTVQANYRPVYDILVRPQHAVLALERQRGLVQSGQLAGTSGGISLDQWRSIQGVPGVSVAAPVAVIGYVMRTVPLTVDLGGALDPARQREVLRVQPTWVTDAGLSRIPDGPAYLYHTRNPLIQTTFDKLADGQTVPSPEEVDPDGRRTPICPPVPVVGERDFIDPTDLTGRSSLTCVGRGTTDGSGNPIGPTVTLAWSVPFLMAAVDPASEAALAGLDRAVTDGRYFAGDEKPGEERLDGMPYPYATLPILLADRPQIDMRLDLDVQRLDGQAVAAVRASTDNRALRAGLDARAGTTVERRTVGIGAPYRDMIRRMRNPSSATGAGEDMVVANTMWLDRFWTLGPPDTVPAGADGLRAREVQHDLKLWGVGADSGDSGHPVPMEYADLGVRGGIAVHGNDTTEHDVRAGDINMPDVALNAIGTFDPGRVNLGSTLAAVPMDAYYRPGAVGMNDASRRALGGRRLDPNANVAGLLSQPPLALTTMAALPKIFGPSGYLTEPDYPELQLNSAAPVSMVRVRLAGAVAMDDVSRERTRVVAEEIAARTGLHVDITLGSSPTAVAVEYPQGRFGRPELSVGESWTRKGVAAVLVRAADRKSVLLAGLVLVVCALAVVNASSAAARSRRIELGVLACLGWTRRQLLRLLCTEIAVIGFAAGVVGTLLAVAVSVVLDLDVGWAHALWGVPTATALTLAAGWWPAWRAARADPGTAVRPAASLRGTRRWSAGRVGGLAVAGLLRTPGRTVLGAASVMIGMAALTVLLAVTFAFRGAVTGTLLGEAVSLQARAVDYLAVGVVIALGVVSVADVLYLNVSERAAEFALLRAVGWGGGPIARLMATEALGIGLLGGLSGAALGLAGASVFAGGVTTPLVWCAGAAACAGVAVAALAAVVPVTLVQRLPTAQILAEE